MTILGGILMDFISAAIFVGVNGLVLWWLSKLFKLHNQTAKMAYTVALYAGIVTFILGLFPVLITALSTIVPTIVFFLINALVLIYLIMKFYKIELGKSVLVWLGVFFADLIIGFIIGLIIGIVSGLFLL